MHHSFSVSRGVAVIDTAAIARNFTALRTLTGGNGRLIAVVKANAYGHGTGAAVSALLAAGCDFFAVASLAEALQVRLHAPGADVLILGYTPPAEAPLLAEAGITQTVFSAAYATALSKAAKTRPVSVHMKIDCGMHRLGFASDRTCELSEAMALPGLRPWGLFTHFPAADSDLVGTRVCFSRFLRCKAALEARGLRLFCHAAASAAALALPETLLDGARVGLALYGIPPVPTSLPLCPAMRLQAPVIQLHSLPAATPVGYGGAFVTRRPTTLGVCPLGYGDGLTRSAEGFTVRLLHGGKAFFAPVVGHICMDQTLLDLTDTPAALGDTVVFFDDPRPLAAHTGTIPYEILTAISHRVERQTKGETTW